MVRQSISKAGKPLATRTDEPKRTLSHRSTSELESTTELGPISKAELAIFALCFGQMIDEILKEDALCQQD